MSVAQRDDGHSVSRVPSALHWLRVAAAGFRARLASTEAESMASSKVSVTGAVVRTPVPTLSGRIEVAGALAGLGPAAASCSETPKATAKASVARETRVIARCCCRRAYMLGAVARTAARRFGDELNRPWTPAANFTHRARQADAVWRAQYTGAAPIHARRSCISDLQEACPMRRAASVGWNVTPP